MPEPAVSSHGRLFMRLRGNIASCSPCHACHTIALVVGFRQHMGFVALCKTRLAAAYFDLSYDGGALYGRLKAVSPGGGCFFFCNSMICWLL